LRSIPPFVTDKPHPRYFPYPTSFIAEEIHNEAMATVNLAKLVIKFVVSYGKEVHELLAREGWAPTLRYCGPLLATESSGIFLEPAQCAPPGLSLRSDLMHMVVMACNGLY
ncbi:hypothetical protein CVT25_002713, partial [Psilocybe cyanescens]